MADGTVRGAFDLDVDSGVRGLHSVRDAGAEADSTLEALGRRMDGLATSAERMSGRVTKAWQSTSRSVSDQADQIETRIDRLEGKLRDLGGVTATPSVNLTGVDRANVAIEELQLRLDRLNRTTASPRVSIAGGGGAGGGAGRLGGGTTITGGGGANRDRMFSSLGGFPGNLPWWALGLPFAPALLGSATSLIGSGVSAGLGAGTVGLGAYGALGAGAALSYAGIKPAISGIQNVTKAQQAYQKAYATYGASSPQTQTAYHNYQVVSRANPGATQAASSFDALRAGYTQATAPARAQAYQGVSSVTRALQPALTAVGGDATLATNATAGAATSYAQFLTQPAQMSALSSLTRAFASDLPLAEKSLEHITTIFEHLSVDAQPFFKDGLEWADKWTGDMATASTNTARVQMRMAGYVNSAKDWAKLTGAAYRTIRDIFSAGTPTGDSMVQQLTDTLDRWDAWINNNPQKVQAFFKSAETTTSNIAGTVANLVRDVSQVASYLSPIISRAAQLFNLVSGLGAGGIGIGGSALYGLYEGARGRLGGRGPSAASLAGAFVTGGAGINRGARNGGGPVIGGAAAQSALTGERSYLAASTGGFRPLYGQPIPAGALGGDLPYLAAIGGARFAGTTRAASVAAATPEEFASRYGGIAGARYAAPLSQLGAETSALAKFGSVASGALEGVAKFALPVLAITSVLQGAQTKGNIGDKVVGGIDSAFHTLTLGLGPKNVLQQIAGTGAAGESFRDPQVRNRLTRESTLAGRARTPGDVRQVDAQARVTARLEMEMSPADSAKLGRQLINITTIAARNAGLASSNVWETSFEMALEREKPTKAVKTMLSGIGTQLKELGPIGAKQFASSTAAWVQQMEADDPKLRGPLSKLMAGIVGDVNHMHDHTLGKLKDLQTQVFYYNGQILTGTDQTWGAIRDSLVNKATVAQEKLQGVFGQIQSEAVNSLTQMGFTKSQARTIVTQTARGGVFAQNQASVVAAKTTTGQTISQGAANNPHARGGVIGGTGLLDTVALPGGAGTAAPGEAYIANRHTMMDLTAATMARFGKTAWQMINDEARPHSAPPVYATGGRIGGFVPDPGTNFTFGQEGSIAAALNRLAQGLHATIYGISGYRSPAHSVAVGGFADDPHTRGIAADIGFNSQLRASAAQITNAQLASVGLWRPFDPSNNPSSSEVNHVQLLAGGAKGSLPMGTGGSGVTAMSVSLHAPNSKLTGIPGTMVNQAGGSYASALSQKLNATLATTAGGGSISGAGWSGGGSSLANQTLGRRMMLSAGWGADQWPSLLALWNQESGWNANAVNPSSGAAGIPQALGHGHPFNLGDAPAQIACPHNYIRGRYGSPSAAEAHERQDNWYSRGGGVNWAGWNAKGGSFTTHGPTLFGAGENGRETITVTPHGQGGRSITVNMEHVYFGAGDKATLKRVAEDVAGEILDALDRTAGGNSDAELAGVA